VSAVLEVVISGSSETHGVDKRILENWAKRHQGFFCRIVVSGCERWQTTGVKRVLDVSLNGNYHLANGIVAKSAEQGFMGNNEGALIGGDQEVDSRAVSLIAVFVGMAEEYSIKKDGVEVEPSGSDETGEVTFESFSQWLRQTSLTRICEDNWSSIEVLEAVAEAEIKYKVRLAVDDIMRVKDGVSLWKEIIRKL